jgi:hypothetical protein
VRVAKRVLWAVQPRLCSSACAVNFVSLRARKVPSRGTKTHFSLRAFAQEKLSFWEEGACSTLEALGRDREGQYAIRINDQYRLRFVWNDGDAYEVEITDYH